MATKPPWSRRELQLRAIEHTTFAEELRWLVSRSLQCLMDGPGMDPRSVSARRPRYPLANNLDDIGPSAEAARIRTEMSFAGARWSEGWTTHNELFTLLETRATNPNATKTDNYSSNGNVNPATGKEGTKDPFKAEPAKPKK